MSTLKAFLAVTAVIAGTILIVNLNILHDREFWWNASWYHVFTGVTTPGSMNWGRVVQAVSGVTLMAAGITYFWVGSRFHRQ